jgi:hypothetical protein
MSLIKIQFQEISNILMILIEFICKISLLAWEFISAYLVETLNICFLQN